MTIVEVVWSVDYAYAFTLTLRQRLHSASSETPPRCLLRFRPNFLRTISQQMSLLAVSRRAAWRAAPRSTRTVVVDAAPKEWTAKREAVKHHAKGA